MLSKRLSKAWSVERLHKALIQILHNDGSWKIFCQQNRFSRLWREYGPHIEILEINDNKSERLSNFVKSSVVRSTLGEYQAYHLMKYKPQAQDKLAEKIIEYALTKDEPYKIGIPKT